MTLSKLLICRPAPAVFTIVACSALAVAADRPALSHSGRFSVFEGTKTCLKCHEEEALQVHASVHYQWKGDSRDVVNAPGVPSGKYGSINDFCIYPDINWIGKLTNNRDGLTVDGGCARCHAGLGLKPASDATREQLENIDCLICHSPEYKRTVASVNGSFRFVPDTAKMSVSVLQAALDIRKPGKAQCLGCHAFSGGGNNYKRGDLEAAHADPPRALDIHMASRSAGGAGLNCTSCHKVDDHRIAGRGSDLRPRDYVGYKVSCTNCHSQTPHGNSRLDKHTRRVDCTTCHIPTFARVAPTDMVRDWSLPAEWDEAKHLYDPAMLKMTNVVPLYRFFNGKSQFYDFGDPAFPSASGKVTMSAPAGSVTEAGARIYPFKYHEGIQPQAVDTLRLLPLKIGIFFATGDFNAAVKAGATDPLVNWGYSGHTFARTERYMMIAHEVAPKDQALRCNSCHNGGKRIDFKLLGYTPKTTRNGRPLCASCHSDESGEWRSSELFAKVHEKHVTDKRINCVECHTFSAAQ